MTTNSQNIGFLNNSQSNDIKIVDFALKITDYSSDYPHLYDIYSKFISKSTVGSLNSMDTYWKYYAQLESPFKQAVAKNFLSHQQITNSIEKSFAYVSNYVSENSAIYVGLESSKEENLNSLKKCKKLILKKIRRILS